MELKIVPGSTVSFTSDPEEPIIETHLNGMTTIHGNKPYERGNEIQPYVYVGPPERKPLILCNETRKQNQSN